MASRFRAVYDEAKAGHVRDRPLRCRIQAKARSFDLFATCAHLQSAIEAVEAANREACRLLDNGRPFRTTIIRFQTIEPRAHETHRAPMSNAKVGFTSLDVILAPILLIRLQPISRAVACGKADNANH